MFAGKRADSGHRSFARSRSQGPSSFPFVYAPAGDIDERSPCINEKTSVTLPHDSNPHMKQLSNALVGYRATGSGMINETGTTGSNSRYKINTVAATSSNNQLELQSMLHHQHQHQQQQQQHHLSDSGHLAYNQTNESRCATTTSGQYGHQHTTTTGGSGSSLSNQRAQFNRSQQLTANNGYVQREVTSQTSTQQLGQSSMQMTGQFTSQLVQYSSGSGRCGTPSMHITANPTDTHLLHFSSKQLHFLNRLHGRHRSIGTISENQPRMSLNHQFYSAQLNGSGASLGNENIGTSSTSTGSSSTVHVRVMHLQSNQRNQQLFIQQAEQLAQLKHGHVQSLLGVCLAGQQYNASVNYLIFEQHSNTSVLQYLQQQPAPAAGQQPLASESQSSQYRQLLTIAQQIASGMSYLSNSNYVHGDLAARNCWIRVGNTPTGPIQVKIGALRLQSFDRFDSESQTIQQLPRNETQLDEPDYYTLWPGETAIPVRWLSPETLQNRTWSSATDVWSFGVLLWELVTYGRQIPFERLSNAQAADSIIAGRLLDCPPYCEPQLHALMLDCWRELPNQRLTFDQAYSRLTQLIATTASSGNGVPPYAVTASNMMYTSDKCISSAASTGYGSGTSSGTGSGTGIIGASNTTGQSYPIAIDRSAVSDHRNISTSSSVGEYEQPFCSIEQTKSRSSRNQTNANGAHKERSCQQQATMRAQTQSGNTYESHYAKISYEDEETESVRSFRFN